MINYDREESVLQEAERLVNGEKRKEYGPSPAEQFGDSAKGWSIILGQEVEDWQVAMCMIWYKMTREMQRHKRDNLVDVAGYAALVEELRGE